MQPRGPHEDDSLAEQRQAGMAFSGEPGSNQVRKRLSLHVATTKNHTPGTAALRLCPGRPTLTEDRPSSDLLSCSRPTLPPGSRRALASATVNAVIVPPGLGLAAQWRVRHGSLRTAECALEEVELTASRWRWLILAGTYAALLFWYGGPERPDRSAPAASLEPPAKGPTPKSLDTLRKGTLRSGR